jgi:hypothetical protein
MKNAILRTSMIVAIAVMTATVASAQTPVIITAGGDTSQTSILTANVSEQARVTVPEMVTFNVTNTALPTISGPQSVTVTNIVLASATKQLQITVTPAALDFSSPGGPTWVSSNVSWGAATFSSAGVGSGGTLAGVATDQPIVTCAVNVSDCSTTNLTFLLAPNAAVKTAGAHTLVIRWKFASIGA